jgi:hypothetical protein
MVEMSPAQTTFFLLKSANSGCGEAPLTVMNFGFGSLGNLPFMDLI